MTLIVFSYNSIKCYGILISTFHTIMCLFQGEEVGSEGGDEGLVQLPQADRRGRGGGGGGGDAYCWAGDRRGETCQRYVHTLGWEGVIGG